MSVISKRVVAKILEDAETTQYTAGAGMRSIIDKCTVTNYSGSSVTVSISLVSSGGVAGDAFLTVKDKSIAAGETYMFPEIVGHTLNSGDFISTNPSAATSVNMRVTVRENT